MGHRCCARSRHSMRGQIVAPLPEQNDLAAGVRFGLEQDRVHAHVGDAPGGECLKILCAADLAARHDPGIVAHVLRLEWRNLQSLPRVPARQGGREEALAGAAGRAAHHYGAGAGAHAPWNSAAISRSNPVT